MKKYGVLLLFVINTLAYAASDVSLPCITCESQINIGQTWNYVLDKPPSLAVEADVYDIDGFETNKNLIDKIHRQNAKAICYLSAGTYENWRRDAELFPKAVIGKSNGWRGERWLDIRQISILLPIMTKRIAMCKAKGFDAIEWDNVDVYTNNSGFPLTADDQLRYNKLLANLAHEAGLAVGLKNDPQQVQELLPYFDFAINEQCFEMHNCDKYLPFIKTNKAVLNVEYKLNPNQFCRKANNFNFSSIKKSLALKEAVIFCNK